MKEEKNIDFVITWVDNKDPDWREKRQRYTGISGFDESSEVRYRDWDLLRFWFRGVEEFAPWVRYVFFVTDEQKPTWLNLNHPKVKWINHKDFIPEEYLPTYSSNTIELNLHRIPELSENFVYFNDDMFLINNVKTEDFFVKGLPCDLPSIGILYALGNFEHMLFNNMEVLTRNFCFNECVKRNLKKWIFRQNLLGLFKLSIFGKKKQVPHLRSYHIHVAYKKSTFFEVWERERTTLDNTCKNKTRSNDDVTSWCVRDWQLLCGRFWPHKPLGKVFHTATMRSNNKAVEYLRKQKGKVICLNDSEDEVLFEEHKRTVIETFEILFPNKSSFEL